MNYTFFDVDFFDVRQDRVKRNCIFYSVFMYVLLVSTFKDYESIKREVKIRPI
jgi:hypothetical protein